MTQDYYGTKRVTAWHQDKDDQPGYAVKYSDGYISWSPAHIFEAAYQPINAMSFGHALAALKEGKRVSRAGWNGKGMFIYLNEGSAPPVRMMGDDTIGGVPVDLFQLGARGTSVRMPNINMKAADGYTVTGWLASQTDMLADDWGIVD